MTSTNTKEGDFEGFGISVIEAALCGVPAIVSRNNNGVIESIKENVTGLSIKEKNYEQFANLTIGLLNDSERGKEMGSNAYERAHNHFTWSTKVDEINELLIDLINEA